MIARLILLSFLLSVLSFSLSYKILLETAYSFSAEKVNSLSLLLERTFLQLSSLNATEQSQHYTAILSRIAHLSSQDSTLIRLAAIDPINKENLPNDLELWVIAYMKARGTKRFKGVTSFREREYFIRAEAVVPDSSCLSCHSKGGKSLWEPGKIQGTVAVYTELTALRNRSLIASAGIGTATGTLLLIGGLFLKRKALSP